MSTVNYGAVRENAQKTPAATPAGLLKLDDFLPHRLNVLSSLVSQALTSVYGRYGIGIPEWRVLVTLGENGVMTGKAVGAHTHMHKTKVSRAVAQLEQRKLVSRRTNRAHARIVPVADAGRPHHL
jgi:predicted transcriptional regulator